MNTSFQIKYIVIVFYICLMPVTLFAQFQNFAGSWRSFNHKTQMEKLTEDDDQVVKYTETLEISSLDEGRKLFVAYSRMDQTGQQSVQSFNIEKDMNGNVKGSDVMNTVEFSGKFSDNGNEQVLAVAGNYINGLNGVFGLELICDNTETGKVLQLKQQLSTGSENPLDLTDISNMYRGMEIETRPGAGDNVGISYWQVLYFKPAGE